MGRVKHYKDLPTPQSLFITITLDNMSQSDWLAFVNHAATLSADDKERFAVQKASGTAVQETSVAPDSAKSAQKAPTASREEFQKSVDLILLAATMLEGNRDCEE